MNRAVAHGTTGSRAVAHILREWGDFWARMGDE